MADEILYRHDESRLELIQQGRPWSFDGDGMTFRLVAEAHRIRLAHLFDPVLAVHTSLVDPLPHQITAVYEGVKARTSPMVLTIGHSTRPVEEFIRLLQAHDAGGVVDVRTIPRSRHNPQFNADSLPASLKKAGIRYRHIPGLGGLRHATAAPVNAGWRNASFRGFADYMQTPKFERALEALIKQAGRRQVALMCAEAVPWRCHRSLIADALLVRGIPTEHITSATRRQPHVLTPFAKVQGWHITYPATDPSKK